jgi:hypothetical protein
MPAAAIACSASAADGREYRIAMNTRKRRASSRSFNRASSAAACARVMRSCGDPPPIRP